MFTFLVPTFLQSSRRGKKKCLLASRFHLSQCNITKCQCYWLVVLLRWIQRRAVICCRSSTICRFVWKQWVICLTSLHLKDCMLLVYALASLSYDGISGSSPAAAAELCLSLLTRCLALRKEEIPSKTASPAHSNQANLAKFTDWLHFLLQEMGMISSRRLCAVLPERPLDSGTQQQFGIQLEKARWSEGGDAWAIWLRSGTRPPRTYTIISGMGLLMLPQRSHCQAKEYKVKTNSTLER